MLQSDDKFTWLHLSDLHVGIGTQRWLWPALKTALFEDLVRLHKRVGAWETVIFSGDLTQAAEPAEFEKLQSILMEVWQQFAALGFSPNLILVPGNHDLVRPKESDPVALLLRRWWDEPSVRTAFWEESSPYAATVISAFSPYSKWVQSLEKTGFSSAVDCKGLLPGDTSKTITIGQQRVGIITLNSSWLQLGAGDYDGQLHVDVRQLLSVTNDDPDQWCAQHDINLLVTHHPPSWLNPESLSMWNSDINCPGRFDSHLFGHMHQPDAITTLQGGSEQRTALQAPSVFGLEKLGDGSIERIHGYSAGRIVPGVDRSFRSIWPRRVVPQTSGKKRFAPDYAFDLDDDDAFVEEYMRKRQPTEGKAVVTVPIVDLSIKVSPGPDAAGDVLAKVRHHLAPAGAHLNVRLIEQQTCIATIRDSRAMWLQADWGAGSDGFLWAVQHRLGQGDWPTYLIDMQAFESRAKFFDTVRETLGCSFEQLCELISKQDEAYLILDDVPLDGKSSGGLRIEADLEEMVKVILEYCPKVILILRTRRAPVVAAFSVVLLNPLDEPELGTYVAQSALGGARLNQPDIINRLFRHTEGAPLRIDTALKELKVVSLSGLVSVNPDFAGTGMALPETPAALKQAVSTISKSSDPILKRSYDLLKTLSTFPQGEQLDRIKRFNNAFPFFPSNASELLERALIGAFVLSEVGVDASAEVEKTLVVPKSVRDYVRATLKDTEVRALDRRALELYFGQKWKSGVLTFPAGHRFDSPQQSVYKMTNGNALILRFLRQSIGETDREETVAGLRLASSYIAALLKGAHYRNIVALCDDLFDVVPEDDFDAANTILRYQYAVSLRMIGEVSRARDILSSIDLSLIPKDSRQNALVNLALCHQSLGEDDLAVSVAEQAIRLGRAENAAIQARSIILELDWRDPDRWQKLKELEDKCRRQKSISVANNIALRRASLAGLEATAAEQIFSQVFLSSVKEKDFYNETRAVIQVSRRRLDRGESLTDFQRSRLIGSYHFLFNERLTSLFESCHDALWMEFEHREDTENLLRLFRHSSLIWRLRGVQDREDQYVKKLAKRVRKSVKDYRGLSRETAYFLMRTSAALLETSMETKVLDRPGKGTSSSADRR